MLPICSQMPLCFATMDTSLHGLLLLLVASAPSHWSKKTICKGKNLIFKAQFLEISRGLPMFGYLDENQFWWPFRWVGMYIPVVFPRNWLFALVEKVSSLFVLLSLLCYLVSFSSSFFFPPPFCWNLELSTSKRSGITGSITHVERHGKLD